MIPIKRSEIINQINSTDIFDLAIIGGGIHGAVTARLASQYGLKTVLLEKNDYASGTSSRSSKMAHGGLRYLELFDFEQVLEGVKAREKLYLDYPQQVIPHPFYIPVYKNDYFFKLKLGIGLKVYDFFNRNHGRRHHWISAKELTQKIPELKSQKLMGCFCYYDGLMCDYRLVLDNITAARKNTSCLNYALVQKVKKENNFLEITYQDSLTKNNYAFKAKAVINTSGNEVDFFGANKDVTLRFSRGSHLLFNQPWNGPALFLPLAGKARYYFVWPHFAGTLVGTTEREVDCLVEDPKPSADEITEILERLKKDLPDSNLNEATLHYSFAGIRALPVRKNSPKGTAQISRKHHWTQDQGIISLYGGKYTTSEWTAKEGFKLALERIGKYSKAQFKELSLFKLDSKSTDLSRQDFSGSKRRQFNLPRDISLFNNLEMRSVVGGDCLRGEIYNAFELEQAVTLDDFLFRRTGIGYLPNCQEILKELKQHLQDYTRRD